MLSAHSANRQHKALRSQPVIFHTLRGHPAHWRLARRIWHLRRAAPHRTASHRTAPHRPVLVWCV